MAKPLCTENQHTATPARSRWPPDKAVRTAKRQKREGKRGRLMRAVRHGREQQISAAIGTETGQQLQTLPIAPEQSALALLAPRTGAAVWGFGQQHLQAVQSALQQLRAGRRGGGGGEGVSHDGSKWTSDKPVTPDANRGWQTVQGWRTGTWNRRTLAGAPARPAIKQIRARSMEKRKAALPKESAAAAPSETGTPIPCCAFFAQRARV